MMNPVVALFDRAVAENGDALAVVDGDRSLTFRRLQKRADDLAVVLRAQGVTHNVCVGVYIHRSLEMVIALLAIMKAGGAYVPLDAEYPPERIAMMLADARVQIVITQGALLEWLPSGVDTVVLERDGRTIISQAAIATCRPVDVPEALAYIIFTSGSTGRPKGAMITQAGFAHYVQWSADAYDVRGGAGSPVHSSISFDLTVTSLWTTLMAGRPVYLLPEAAGVTALAAALRERKNFSLVKLTPSHLDLLQKELQHDELQGCTRRFVVGGESLFGESLEWWQDRLPGIVFVNEYGPTETVVGCCVEFIASDQRLNGQVSIGKPIDRTHMYVLNEGLQPLPIGEAGEVYIGGAGVGLGYIGRPDLSAQCFLPDPFCASTTARLYRTGDLARLHADGRFEFLGRVDDQVKWYGYRIELGEIEAALRAHPLVGHAAVTVHRGLPQGDVLAAYVVATASEESAPPAQVLQGFLRQTLPAHMIPQSIHFLDFLPLTNNGKTNRAVLPAPAMPIAVSLPKGDAAMSPVEAIVLSVFEHVFPQCSLGIGSGFRELGGQSIQAVQIATRLEQYFGLRLPLRTILRSRTLADVVEALLHLAPDRKQLENEALLALQGATA